MKLPFDVKTNQHFFWTIFLFLTQCLMLENLKSDSTSMRFLCLIFITAKVENPNSHKLLKENFTRTS